MYYKTYIVTLSILAFLSQTFADSIKSVNPDDDYYYYYDDDADYNYLEDEDNEKGSGDPENFGGSLGVDGGGQWTSHNDNDASLDDDDDSSSEYEFGSGSNFDYTEIPEEEEEAIYRPHDEDDAFPIPSEQIPEEKDWLQTEIIEDNSIHHHSNEIPEMEDNILDNSTSQYTDDTLTKEDEIPDSEEIATSNTFNNEIPEKEDEQSLNNTLSKLDEIPETKDNNSKNHDEFPESEDSSTQSNISTLNNNSPFSDDEVPETKDKSKIPESEDENIPEGKDWPHIVVFILNENHKLAFYIYISCISTLFVGVILTFCCLMVIQRKREGMMIEVRKKVKGCHNSFSNSSISNINQGRHHLYDDLNGGGQGGHNLQKEERIRMMNSNEESVEIVGLSDGRLKRNRARCIASELEMKNRNKLNTKKTTSSSSVTSTEGNATKFSSRNSTRKNIKSLTKTCGENSLYGISQPPHTHVGASLNVNDEFKIQQMAVIPPVNADIPTSTASLRRKTSSGVIRKNHQKN